MEKLLSDNFITRAIAGYNGLSRRRCSAAVCVIYVAFVASVMYFHEPWYDESHTWVLAKYSSLYELLFIWPHYEGHPPFYAVILSIAGRSRLPMRPTIEILHLISVAFFIAFFEFRSPFANLSRTVIPFTYWVFQFSVYTRPYTLFIIALFLCADSYPGKDNKPGRFIFSLIFLCCTHLYGIAIAGGITIAWIWDIYSSDRKHFIASLLSNRKRLAGFTILLIPAILITALIFPAEDIYTAIGTSKHGASLRIVNLLKTALRIIFYMPSEATVTAFFPDYFTGGLRAAGSVSPLLSETLMCAASVFCWFLMIKHLRRQHFPLAAFLLPVIMYMSIACFYLNDYHVGILFILAIYALWISKAKNETPDPEEKEENNGNRSQPDSMRVIMNLISAAVMLNTLYWTFAACRIDVNTHCWYTEDLADWITGNGLEDYTWFSAWDVHIDEENEEITDLPQYNYIGDALTGELGFSLTYNSYQDRPFVQNKLLDESQTSDVIRSFERDAAPDFVITNGTGPYYFIGSSGMSASYTPVYYDVYGMWYRDKTMSGAICVWANTETVNTSGIRTSGI